MSLTGRILAGLLGLAGLPLAGLLVHQDLAAPWVAIVLLVLYEVVILLGTIVASVAQKVVRRRVEQVMDVLDLALGRRVSRYARYYRRYVLERDRHINARDLAYTPSHIPELDAVYVDVGLAPGSTTSHAGGLLPTSRADQAQRHSIHEFLDKDPAIVCAVIGAPGSGKSTLLRHTARLAASQGKERKRRVPVMLALRDHADALTSDPSRTLAQLIRAEVGTLTVAEPAGWWEAQLRNGNCLILLDGLDEIARSDDRAAVSEWIEKQIAKNPKNDFVITSRPHGYQTAVIPQATLIQVRPFTTPQIRQFVHGWCRAAEQQATNASGPEIDQRARESAEDLIDQLSSAPTLMELAVNPLLLTMMVLVHRERRSLPAGRADLYNQVCDVMLWRRQESKKLEVRPPGAVRQRILAALAYDMMVAETRDYPRAEVLAVFERALRQIDTDISAEELLTAVVDTSGLLVERERDLYAFAHHTIGEYLASTHIRSKNLGSTLIRSVGDPWWRETTLLYVTDTEASDIVKACLEKNTGASLALAFDCVRSHGQIDRLLRVFLDRLLEDAFEDDAEPKHRVLITNALVTGYLSRFITDEAGTLISPYAVPEQLYWLFCKAKKIPVPEGINETRPSPTRPAAGMWRSDANAFYSWISLFSVFNSLPVYRPPTVEEVEFLADNGPNPFRSGGTDVTIWIWAPGDHNISLCVPHGSDPYLVTKADIRNAVEADLADGSILVDILLAGVLADARAITYVLEQAFTRELHVNTAAEVEALGRNFEFIYQLTEHLANDFPISPGLDLERIRARADKLIRFDFHNGNSIRATDVAYSLVEALTYPNVFAVSNINGPFGVRPYLRVTILGPAITEAKSASSGLGSALTSTVLDLLVPQATVFNNPREPVDPDTLPKRLQSACAALSSINGEEHELHQANTIAARLLSGAMPVLERKHRSEPRERSNLRILALMASAQAVYRNRPELAEEFNYIAAGLTLLDKRAAGKVPLETIILVRE